MTPVQLPEVPAPKGYLLLHGHMSVNQVHGYTAAQLRVYGQQCARTYAAHSRDGEGEVDRDVIAREAGHPTFSAMDQCANAWLAVVSLLHEVSPNWLARPGNGRESALAAIRELATPPTPSAGVEVTDEMVSDAVAGYWIATNSGSCHSEAMRAALTAALEGGK